MVFSPLPQGEGIINFQGKIFEFIRNRLATDLAHAAIGKHSDRRVNGVGDTAGLVAGTHDIAVEATVIGLIRDAVGIAADGTRILFTAATWSARCHRPAHVEAWAGDIAIHIFRIGACIVSVLAAVRAATDSNRVREYWPPPAGSRRHIARRPVGSRL